MNYLNYNAKESNLEDFFTIIYVLVDDIYKEVVPKRIKNRKNICQQKLTDSELITISIVGECVLGKSENSYFSFIEKNYRHLFSDWIDETRFNRTIRNLHSVIELIRISVLEKLEADKEIAYIVDSMPISVCEFGRAKFCSGFKDTAKYGYCASKKETLYGFKLHVLTTLSGIPVKYVLEGANEHDITVLPELVSNVYNVCVLGDKGYVGEDLKVDLLKTNQIKLYALQRGNQKNKYPKELNSLLKSKRKRIETTFSQLCDQFELEKVYAKTIWGMITRIKIKLLSFVLCCLINKLRGCENLVKIKELVF